MPQKRKEQSRKADLHGKERRDKHGEGDIYGEGTHTDRGGGKETHGDKRRGDIRKREEGYDMYREGIYMKRRQIRGGDYIRKGLHGEGTHKEEIT